MGIEILRNDPYGFDRLVKLPDVCIEKIISFIHFDDLLNTKKAYRGHSFIPLLIDKTKKKNEKRDKKQIKCYLADCNNYFWSKVSHSRHMNNMHGFTPKGKDKLGIYL